MTKDAILIRYLGGKRITHESTPISINTIMASFPEESREVLQAVVDEYNFRIATEQYGLLLNDLETGFDSATIKARYPDFSDECAERVQNEINTIIALKELRSRFPININASELVTTEMAHSVFGDSMSVEQLNDVVERYNFEVTMQEIVQRPERLDDLSEIRSEAILFSYPSMSNRMASKVADECNALMCFNAMRNKLGRITAETAFVDAKMVMDEFYWMSEEVAYNVCDKLNAVIALEQLQKDKPISYRDGFITAEDLVETYPGFSADMLNETAYRYNIQVMVRQLMHEKTPTKEATLITLETWKKSFPDMPFKYLIEAIETYNGMIIHDQFVSEGVEVGNINGKEVNLQKYKKSKQKSGNITLVVKNMAELSAEELEELEEVEKVIIRDKDNTPETGCQCKPYSRLEYIEARRTLDEVLKDVEYPQSKEDELNVFLQIVEKLATHIDEYDDFAITKMGEADQRLEKTCRNCYGGLVQGKCVCAGFADILRNAAACRGIEVKYIQGFEKEIRKGKDKVEGHAWNQVCINGEWLNVDLTWALNEIKANGGKIPEQMRFLRSDEQFADHENYCVSRTKSERKCPRTLEEVISGVEPKDKLRQAVRHFATDSKGRGVRLSEIRRVGDFFGKILGVNRGAHQREQDEIQA